MFWNCANGKKYSSRILETNYENENIFDEIKKLRKCKPVIANSIDGVTEDIPGHFSGIYKQLYNSVNDREEVLKISDQLETKISFSSLEDVNQVTAARVKEATEKLKDGKSDPICDISSDCILFDLLAAVIRGYLIHGHVSLFLLLATLVPIVKDKLANICSSKNYRSIAISSLILKIIDWIIILLFGVTLGLDDLQFAYQAKCSTYMCSWIVIETINYFIRNGSDVFCCMMDMTKAFDLVKWSVIFTKLINRNLSAIFIRLLLFMCVFQSVNVRWNGKFSDHFSITNGCKQGMVLSAIFTAAIVRASSSFWNKEEQAAG